MKREIRKQESRNEGGKEKKRGREGGREDLRIE